MDGNSGYLSHSLYPLYFGLGAARGRRRIEVAWPSGKKQIGAGRRSRSTRDRGRERSAEPSAPARLATRELAPAFTGR